MYRIVSNFWILGFENFEFLRIEFKKLKTYKELILVFHKIISLNVDLRISKKLFPGDEKYWEKTMLWNLN